MSLPFDEKALGALIEETPRIDGVSYCGSFNPQSIEYPAWKEDDSHGAVPGSYRYYSCRRDLTTGETLRNVIYRVVLSRLSAEVRTRAGIASET